MGSRRWQYDLSVNKTHSLRQLKQTIVEVVRRVPGVLSDPEPEALLVDANPDTAKVRILWSTHDSRQHQMLGSYDQVLTEIVDALEKTQNVEKQ